MNAIVSLGVAGGGCRRNGGRAAGDIDLLSDLDQIRVLNLLIREQQIRQAYAEFHRNLCKRIARLNFVDVVNGRHVPPFRSVKCVVTGRGDVASVLWSTRRGGVLEGSWNMRLILPLLFRV